MDYNCKLEILTNDKATYEDDYYYYEDRRIESASVGGDKLMLLTAELLSDWVEKDVGIHRAGLEILGQCLYRIAFCTPNIPPGSAGRPWPLKDAFESAYAHFRRTPDPNSQLRLMLVLHEEAERLAMLPWEFLFMIGDENQRERGFFLAGEKTELILTRFVPGVRIEQEFGITFDRATFDTDAGDNKLRILIALSEPAELGGLGANRLIGDLKNLESQRPEQFEVRDISQPTWTSLHKVITDFRPHILHFIGHGDEDKLAFIQDERSIREAEANNEYLTSTGQEPQEVAEARWLDSLTVSELFKIEEDRDYKPRLVFLHACKGAKPSLFSRSLESFSSTAQRLAYTEIPAVIAMQYEIDNENAEVFARRFYSKIREGKRIDEAVVQARRALGAEAVTLDEAWGNRNFATPVIYLQSQKPIIGPPPGVGPPPDGEKVACPNLNCTGLVAPGNNFCSVCGKRLMLCPNCRSVMLEESGSCVKCEYRLGSGTQPADAGSRPTTAVPQDPASSSQLE